MSAEFIGSTLKKARKNKGLHIKEVAAELQKQSIHVALKTIYGWENGQSCPRIDIFLCLCKLYGITDILGEFGYTQSDEMILTEQEKNLIKAYRSLPELQHPINVILNVS